LNIFCSFNFHFLLTNCVSSPWQVCRTLQIQNFFEKVHVATSSSTNNIPSKCEEELSLYKILNKWCRMKHTQKSPHKCTIYIHGVNWYKYACKVSEVMVRERCAIVYGTVTVQLMLISSLKHEGVAEALWELRFHTLHWKIS
jgi:hypothetical protein